MFKARPYKLDKNGFYQTCNAKDATHVQLYTPGPIYCRMIPIDNGGIQVGPKWTWNRDVFKPTLRPSILSNTVIDGKDIRCHSFITDGNIEFLSDCTHELAGKTLPLEDIEDDTQSP